jgi:CHAD domain-containing protein
MATTTTPSESAPLARQLVLDETKLRSQLLVHLSRASDAAKGGAANADLARGVHEVRKAARRVRAIAELLSEALSRRELRSVTNAIRGARHTLGPARDHAVAAHLVGQLSLDEPVREAAKLVVQAAALDAPSAEETRTALEESAAIVAAQAEVVKEALPERLTFALLVTGVQRVYRRARRARKAAKRSKRAFHAWRRRSKELAYQLDVLGDLSSDRLSKLRAALGDVADGQRDAVDLLMLRDFTRAHRDRVDPDAVDLVLEALGTQIRPLLGDVRRAGKAAFSQKPRPLGRSACRDATVGVAHA